MISIHTTSTNFWDNNVEAYIFFMDEKLASPTATAHLATIEKDYYPHIKELLVKHRFEGKKDQSFMLTAPRNGKLIEFIFVGLGKGSKAWNVELETLRRALAHAVQMLKKNGIPSGVACLPDAANYNISTAELIKQMTVIAHMADYEFTTYKKASSKGPWNGKLLLEVNPEQAEELAQCAQQGEIIGAAVNEARHWADSPANIMTPTALSKEAEKIAAKHNLSCTIFGREKALELGMGAFCSVDAGSDQDGKFVILEYRSTVANAPTISLVGKGITFDTGGINIKPTDGMTGMQYDMSGAAAVIATMNIIAQLKPAINVMGITPLVENMPSGKASRPGDIVTAMNGKTIEIRNTDAEGRLVLSDALCYTEKFHKPELIIDIATLTGACVHALGYFYSAVMTQDENLSDALSTIGKLTGDRVWPLPLDDDYKPANKSNVADIGNTGSPAYRAGTIIGGCFLSEFVEKARWAHIDIAGTADTVPGINYLGKGSAGATIRLLTEFVMNYKKYIN